MCAERPPCDASMSRHMLHSRRPMQTGYASQEMSFEGIRTACGPRTACMDHCFHRAVDDDRAHAAGRR